MNKAKQDNNKPVRILIVDDHAIVRKGILALLNEVDGFEVAGEASNGAEAVEQASRLHPDVILMDLVMPVMDGIKAISAIIENNANAHILALTSFASDDKVFPAIKAGALGYILKSSAPEELVKSIWQVYNGEPSLQPSIARKVLHEISHPADGNPTPEPLTERELEVLKLVAKGSSNQAIAEKLVISEPTVRTHVSNILSKLQVANRVQATLYALRAGISQLENNGDAEKDN